MTPGDQAIRDLHATFAADAELLIRAPGRVNLIGEHTDYNDGFVLPIATEQALWLAVRSRTDRQVRVKSEVTGEAAFDLDSMKKSGTDWIEYVKGVAWALGLSDLRGWDGAIISELPVGAGLSSSAALEIAAALAFTTTAEREWEPLLAAQAGQKAENGWVGLSSGIMDQLIVAIAKAGHATLIDCRSLSLTPTPVPPSMRPMILDTGTRRRLIDSKYRARRDTCERVARAAGVPALRDLAFDDLPRLQGLIGEVDYRRTRHVVTENARTLQAASALETGDTALFGRLMVESHDSLRDGYEVSSPALDAIVEAALRHDACHGARMTGAGFGGCAIALVEESEADAFAQKVAREYSFNTGNRPAIFSTQPSQGAHSV